jgi:starch synthase
MRNIWTFLKDKQKHKDKFSLHLAFSDEMARKIYAGSDLFLMPSKYEPCGLGQLISLKYGTIPIVRNTGGLADTISRY